MTMLTLVFLKVSWAMDLPKLTVYTTQSFAKGIGVEIKNLFEKQEKCQIEYIFCSGTFSTLSQIKANRDQGDLIVGFTAESLLENEVILGEIFVPYHRFSFQKRTDLPLKWTTPYLTPISYTFLSFVYDSQKINQKIGSFEDLLTVPGKIILIDPRTSSPGLGLLLWVKLVYGKEAASFWKRLKLKILTIPKSWSEAYGLFLQGEAPLVLSYITSPTYHRLIEKKSTIRAMTFKEGRYIQVYVAAILQQSTQKELAQRFLDLLLSPEIQEKIPKRDWSYPVIKIKEPFPEEFQIREMPLLDGTSLMKDKKNLLREWLDAVS